MGRDGGKGKGGGRGKGRKMFIENMDELAIRDRELNEQREARARLLSISRSLVIFFSHLKNRTGDELGRKMRKVMMRMATNQRSHKGYLTAFI